MNFYEHTYITSPELSSQETDSVRKKINDILEKNDGRILKEEDWGIRSLAYPIKKSSKGKYSNIYIEGNNKVIKEIELFERYDERVIKFLSIKIKKIPEENSELVKTA
jgi:small subunit ribosomal protein S6|tara:strand:+ start:22 stop:345 length:324 start_codon:yes stop_codon:yes gene_type:complete